MIQMYDWNSNRNHFGRMKQVKNQFHDNLKRSTQMKLKIFVSKKFHLTLLESLGNFFSFMVNSCCFVIMISPFRRLTFCPSNCSSIFGARFRRTLSVVEIFFKELVLLLVVVVVEPNRRKGEVGMGLKSRISMSGGLAISCCERV